ncbi:hypothetical protein EAG_05667 [Camponotus floridanus]|uniref:Uncharacterized protein n=1 Tax=Camponotus floridanus TaxID=104421 RepID=E1ZXV6_CAMFO|nr:hypothetical protein EAG_05667 [Camponotus floridanus]
MDYGGPTKETPAATGRVVVVASCGGGIYKSNKTVEQQLLWERVSGSGEGKGKAAKGRKGEGERDKPGGEKRKREREQQAKQSKRERDETRENSDPTRPTGSTTSARISCSATPILRGSH